MTLGYIFSLRLRCTVLTAFAFANAATLAMTATQALGCVLCGGVQPTLSQEIKGSELAIIAKLVALPDRVAMKDGELSVATPMARFEVQEALKGAAAIEGTKVIEAPFFGDKPVGGEYLVLGTLSPDVVWSPPYALSPRSRKYVSEMVKLPPSGAERLAYFQDFLEDKEDLLRNDSGYEFALAPIRLCRTSRRGCGTTS